MTGHELNTRAKKLKKTAIKLQLATNEYDVRNLYASMERQWKLIRLSFLPERFSKRRSSRWIRL